MKLHCQKCNRSNEIKYNSSLDKAYCVVCKREVSTTYANRQALKAERNAPQSGDGSSLVEDIALGALGVAAGFALAEGLSSLFDDSGSSSGGSDLFGGSDDGGFDSGSGGSSDGGGSDGDW